MPGFKNVYKFVICIDLLALPSLSHRKLYYKQIIFISPYSYMLNPIEYSFSIIKSVVRRILGKGYSENFIELIFMAIGEITMSDLNGYFMHMRNNRLKAVNL